MTISADAAASAVSATLRPAFSAFGQELLSRLKTNDDVNSRVTQVICVRMTLAAVAENSNFFP